MVSLFFIISKEIYIKIYQTKSEIKGDTTMENMINNVDNYKELIEKSKIGDDPVYQEIENTSAEGLVAQKYVKVCNQTMYTAISVIESNKVVNNEKYICIVKDNNGTDRYAFICIGKNIGDTKENKILVHQDIFDVMHDKFYAVLYKLNDSNLTNIMERFRNHFEVDTFLWYQSLIMMVEYEVKLDEDHRELIKKNDITLLCRDGYSHIHRGEYIQAIEDFEKAVELRPYNGVAYFGLGQAYIIGEQFDKAIENLRKVVVYGIDSDGVNQDDSETWEDVKVKLGMSILANEDRSIIQKRWYKVFIATMERDNRSKVKKAEEYIRYSYNECMANIMNACAIANEYIEKNIKGKDNLRERRTFGFRRGYNEVEKEFLDKLVNTGEKPVKSMVQKYKPTNNKIGIKVLDNEEIEIRMYGADMIYVTYRD